MRTFLLNLLLIQIFIKNQIIINDSTFLRKYTGSRKYVAASRKITIVHTIEHLLAHFDLHSNIGWFITRIVSTGCSTIIECSHVSSSFRLTQEWNVLLLHFTAFKRYYSILKTTCNSYYKNHDNHKICWYIVGKHFPFICAP